MNRLDLKYARRNARKKHVRRNVIGTQERPRISVYRSNKHISVQVIDDSKGHTLVAASSLEKDLNAFKNTVDGGAKLGKVLGERMKAAKIDKAVFDRNGFKYHGVIKAIAEAARETGIDF